MGKTLRNFNELDKFFMYFFVTFRNNKVQFCNTVICKNRLIIIQIRGFIPLIASN